MPELPEVETIRRGLEKVLIGQTISSVDVRYSKSFQGNPDQIIGQKVVGLERRAKVLIWRLENCYILIHLKMTGQVIYVPKGGAEKDMTVGGHPDKVYGFDLPHKHTHVIIQFDRGTLYFNDLRKFGWIKVVNSLEAVQELHAHIGPEYTSPEFSSAYFRAGLAKRRITIKQTLLDQTFIAGIGNIYADESLFCAKVQPLRKSNELKPNEISQLFKCIPEIFELSLSHGGTSSQNYRLADGSMGTYLKVAKVYKREGLPCTVCSTPILRIKISGRSSHFCPNCQK